MHRALAPDFAEWEAQPLSTVELSFSSRAFVVSVRVQPVENLAQLAKQELPLFRFVDDFEPFYNGLDFGLQNG